MTREEIKTIIRQEMPEILQDREMRDYILRSVNNYFAGKQETESRFDQILEELRRDREEQSRKWEENQRQIEQLLQEIKAVNRKYDSSIGAIGARWGLYSESSFRNALKAILEESFGVQVVNITEYDDQGEVFGRPDQVELDLLIKNGLLIICEIKSSVSKSEVYIFEKKVQFYQRRHQREANRKIVISPMVADNAQKVAQDLGIEVYSYARDVEVS